MIECKASCLVEKSKKGGKWGVVAKEGVPLGYSADNTIPGIHETYTIPGINNRATEGPGFRHGCEMAGWPYISLTAGGRWRKAWRRG